MERTATISMKSARILALLRGPGVRFEPVSGRTVRVHWEPSYDERILAQARATEFPDRDANAIFRTMDFPIARGTVGRSRSKSAQPTAIRYGSKEKRGPYLERGEVANWRHQMETAGFKLHTTPSGILIATASYGADRRRVSGGRSADRAARRRGVR